ncbi:hypothetical protein BN176_1120003 [Clostridioides difficile E19]|nr:hypothetical protein BN176_1120003 [Clostridioides difficile E19]
MFMFYINYVVCKNKYNYFTNVTRNIIILTMWYIDLEEIKFSSKSIYTIFQAFDNIFKFT